jgi:hypothetical protein
MSLPGSGKEPRLLCCPGSGLGLCPVALQDKAGCAQTVSSHYNSTVLFLVRIRTTRTGSFGKLTFFFFFCDRLYVSTQRSGGLQFKASLGTVQETPISKTTRAKWRCSSNDKSACFASVKP